MSLRVLIIPDKFKGTLTASAAAHAIASGWRRSRPKDQLTLLPMSDGGDGFGEVLGSLIKAQSRTTETVDAAHRPCTATWSLQSKLGIAVVESAKVIGLAMLPKGKYHPFDLDTFGLGTVLQAASQESTQCLIGIGGSATNDAGFGMARALGWKFLNWRNRPIERWMDLAKLVRIIPAKVPRPFESVTVAVDVQNPLVGKYGCTRIYGPQKGIRPNEFTMAEKPIRRFSKVIAETIGRDFTWTPGAGAAGGLGFGLMAFLGAKPQSGYDLFAKHADLARRLKSVDLVITGEGCIDESTLMGKGVGEIARACRRADVRCIGLSGAMGPTELLEKRFDQVRALTQITSAANATSKPEKWLTTLTSNVARDWGK